MMKNWAKRASEYGQITKIGLSEGCGGETIPMTVGTWYCRGRFGGYLGNARLTPSGVEKAIEWPPLRLTKPFHHPATTG